eukprot:CAMPEP_0181266774 /NCGR_PEP_ID=MMETSP1097-20121128/4478_1 /TAXON_ID=35684 /ORGANISM="Pseudopedinella elastica, Strain CCMP716" /LENGTH=93 /DNA_ID=CAMNT_0023366021 /DNA_START=280 /DNA_END=558 /DNA_ORIENTATION=-
MSRATTARMTARTRAAPAPVAPPALLPRERARAQAARANRKQKAARDITAQSKMAFGAASLTHQELLLGLSELEESRVRLICCDKLRMGKLIR